MHIRIDIPVQLLHLEGGKAYIELEQSLAESFCKRLSMRLNGKFCQYGSCSKDLDDTQPIDPRNYLK